MFQCTPVITDKPNPAFVDTVGLRQWYLRPIAGSTVFLASADVASLFRSLGCKH